MSDPGQPGDALVVVVVLDDPDDHRASQTADQPSPPWVEALEVAAAPGRLDVELIRVGPDALSDAVAAGRGAEQGVVVLVPAERVEDVVAALAADRPEPWLSAGTALIGLAGERDVSAVSASPVGCIWVDATSPRLADQLRALLTALAPRLRASARLARRLDAEAWSKEQVEYLVHDLKNPLGTILTNLHLLKPRVGGDDVSLRLIGDADNAARRLERMVLDLLDFGRLQAGQLELDPITIRVDDLVEEAVAAVAPAARARAVDLTLALGDRGERVVDVDFDLMTRVLINLLENAIRHSPAGSEVTVSLEPIDDPDPDDERLREGLRIVVADRGVGVPEAWRDRIFERFVQRGGNGPGRAGRGLGLAFAKLVADAHGVPIGVEPGRPSGSRFFVGLPASRGNVHPAATL